MMIEALDRPMVDSPAVSDDVRLASDADLVRMLGEAHRAVGTFMSGAFAHAVTAGEVLEEKQSRLPRGDWQPWLRDMNAQIGLGRPTAYNYMRAFTHQDQIRAKVQDPGHLTLTDAIKLLAHPRTRREQ